MSPEIKIRDVARLAGVSPGTVSNTLNHPHRVKPATRERVQAAIQELGFIPSQAARMLNGAPSSVIALVMLDVSPFYMELASAVEQAVRETGHVVMLCHSENSRDKEVQLLQMLKAQGVRGALVSPASGGDSVVERVSGSVPVVFLDHNQIKEGCAVAVDDLEGGRIAAHHLIELGRDNLAFVGGPIDLRQMAVRAAGFQRGMAESGLSQPPRCVHVDNIGFEGGMEAARRLLDEGLPSGILFGNDLMAFGFYRVLAAAGVRVPDDVALIGYDDIRFAAEWIVPLTSVRQPILDMGRRAATLLLEHSANSPDHRHQQIFMEPELVVRASTVGDSTTT